MHPESQVQLPSQMTGRPRKPARSLGQKLTDESPGRQ
jgi:hypothetical protein